MKKFIKENRKGFTLIELLVVIAILAVLATLYVPRIVKSTNDAKETVEIANARTLASEITMYNAGVTDTADLLLGTGTGTTPVKTGSTNTCATALTGLAGTNNVVLEANITGHAEDDAKALLNGRKFPDADIVVLITDDKGNCFIRKPDGTDF